MSTNPIPWHELGLDLWKTAGLIRADVVADPAHLAALDQSVAYMTAAAHQSDIDLNDPRTLWNYLCGGLSMLAANGASRRTLAMILAGMWTKLPDEAKALANQ